MITRYPRELPDLLSVGEAARLLVAAPTMKYKAALGVAYGAGLRISQVAHLKTARTLQSLWNDHPTKYGAPDEGRTRTVIISRNRS